ncbi:MAG: DNA repair exonuclease [Firmicutes bacterium HGW-Firmicutes-16]|nr:MAG: DNA repair exonuclease [Firmicutes bacterium HGW-Firmicutes-16]
MRELKLLHAADLHLDSAFESLSPEQAAERRQGQRELLFSIEEIAEKRGVDVVLLSGDVFEGNSVKSETQRDIGSSLGALPCPVMIAPGNHDPYSTHSVWETLRLPENVYVFKNAEIKCVEIKGIPARFWGAGFQNTFSPPLLRGFSAPEKTDEIPDVMVIHGDTGVGASDYNPISRDDLIKSGMDYVALGHIHARTPVLRAGKTAYAYPGCAEGRGYDETGEKGALLVTISDNGVKAEFVPLGGVRYEIISVDIGGKEAFAAITDATSELSANDCCRLILTGECETPPDVNVLRKSLEGKFRELQLRDETVLKRDVWAQRGQDTLTGVFLDRLYIMYESAKSDKELEKISLAAKYGLSAIENGGELI